MFDDIDISEFRFETREVATQRGLEMAVAVGAIPECTGNGDFDVRGGRAIARDNSVVYAYGNSKILADGYSEVKTEDKVRVIARARCKVKATGNSVVIASDHSDVVLVDASIARAFNNTNVYAFGKGLVEARDDCRVFAHYDTRVVARDRTHVEAYAGSVIYASDNAYVVCRDASTVHASGHCHVVAHDTCRVFPSKYVTVTIVQPFRGYVGGAISANVPTITHVREWCNYYGVKVDGFVAVVYVAVGKNYSNGLPGAGAMVFEPGTAPGIPGYDTPDSYGKALANMKAWPYFSPSPSHALEMNPSATAIIACPIITSEAVVVENSAIPRTIKAPRVCAPCYEVDFLGNDVSNCCLEGSG